MAVSRVLHGISGRSAAELPHELTLPPLRALVVLDDDAVVTVKALAERLGIQPSTTTRLVDRLVPNGSSNERRAWKTGARSCSRSPPPVAECSTSRCSSVEQAIREILESLTRAERASVLDPSRSSRPRGRASPIRSPSTRCDHARAPGTGGAGRSERTAVPRAPASSTCNDRVLELVHHRRPQEDRHPLRRHARLPRGVPATAGGVRWRSPTLRAITTLLGSDLRGTAPPVHAVSVRYTLAGGALVMFGDEELSTMADRAHVIVTIHKIHDGPPLASFAATLCDVAPADVDAAAPGAPDACVPGPRPRRGGRAPA